VAGIPCLGLWRFACSQKTDTPSVAFLNVPSSNLRGSKFTLAFSDKESTEMAQVDSLNIDLAGGETKTSKRRTAAGLASDLFSHLKPVRRDSMRVKTVTSAAIEKALATTAADVEKQVDSSKLILFAHDKSQGRSLLSDDYAKLLAMCFNSSITDVSCPTDQEKGWISWAEKWFSRYCAVDNKHSTEIQIDEHTCLPEFEWFSEYSITGNEDLAEKMAAANFAHKKYKSVSIIHSDTAKDSVEAFDDQRGSNVNCGFIAKQVAQTKTAYDAGQSLRPLFVLLNVKDHFSLLSTMDGSVWNHFDSSKDGIHEDYARLWVRRTRQLCTEWLNQDELSTYPRNFTLVTAQDRAKSQPADSPFVADWIHDEPHSSLLICLTQVSLFLATKFNIWPLLPLPISDESVSQLLQILRQQCRYFFTFLTWFQHLKLQKDGSLEPKKQSTHKKSDASPRKAAK
jgi:hypothetical protein